MLNDTPLSETHTIRGRWWQVEQPQRRVSGTLVYSPVDGIHLDLDRPLSDAGLFSGRAATPVILGVAQRGKKVSLIDCRIVSWSNAHSEFNADYAIIGAHIRDEASPFLTGFAVEYQHLAEWASISGFQRDARAEPETDVIAYRRPEPRLLASTEQYSLCLYLTGSQSQGIHEASIRESATVDLTFRSRQTLTTCLRTMRLFQDFLALAIGEPPFPLTCLGSRGAVRLRNGRVENLPVGILYQPMSVLKQSDLRRFRMLLTLPALGETPDVIIRNWLDKAQLLEPVCNLYRANLYSPALYVENRFLNLTQALETYHRRVFGGKYQDDETYLSDLYQSFVAAIPPGLDSDFTQSLREGKLRYANEYSLRRRLNELLTRYRDSLADTFVAQPSARRLFVDQVVYTRNYLTHYDRESAAPTASGKQLVILELKLRRLLEACLLTNIGVNSELVRQLMAKSQTFQHIVALERS